MAVTHPPFPAIPPIPGFRLATAACGLKQNGAQDLLLVEMHPCHTAGVFTRNLVVAAPVTLCRQRLANGTARALLVNSGNANAANGQQGIQDALATTNKVAETLHLEENTIFVASTGIIGKQLATHNILQTIPTMATRLMSGNWQDAASSIMTTDTFAKGGFCAFRQNGHDALLAGIAKGSGMIHPDMATMLAFLFTDAAISATALQVLLNRAVADSFNSITVDGDTSTNDTVLAFASGLCGAHLLDDPNDPQAKPLAMALHEVCQTLAQNIVRDGEGASKFITITCSQARTPEDAKQVVLAIAKSPLVKTACAGCDPNWGRILAAIGYANVDLDPDLINISLNDVPVVQQGMRAPQYCETQGEEVMKREEITISIGLGLGQATHTVWTCDLTHDYISINADYHT